MPGDKTREGETFCAPTPGDFIGVERFGVPRPPRDIKSGVVTSNPGTMHVLGTITLVSQEGAGTGGQIGTHVI